MKEWIILILLFSSCKSNVNDLNGYWIMKSFSDNYKTSNLVNFKKDQVTFYLSNAFSPTEKIYRNYKINNDSLVIYKIDEPMKLTSKESRFKIITSSNNHILMQNIFGVDSLQRIDKKSALKLIEKFNKMSVEDDVEVLPKSKNN